MPSRRLTSVKTDGKFKLDHLSGLLDTFVAMHWDLTNGLHDGADLPKVLTDHLQLVDRDLQATILTLKILLREKEPPV